MTTQRLTMRKLWLHKNWQLCPYKDHTSKATMIKQNVRIDLCGMTDRSCSCLCFMNHIHTIFVSISFFEITQTWLRTANNVKQHMNRLILLFQCLSCWKPWSHSYFSHLVTAFTEIWHLYRMGIFPLLEPAWHWKTLRCATIWRIQICVVYDLSWIWSPVRVPIQATSPECFRGWSWIFYRIGTWIHWKRYW